MTDALAKSLGTLALGRPRWRTARSFDGPDGPPPKFARVAQLVYLATAMLLALLLATSVVGAIYEGFHAPDRAFFEGARIIPKPWSGIVFFALIAAYAFGLSRGVARLRSPDCLPAGAASCTLLIVHGLAGLYGTVALVAQPFVGRRSSLHEFFETGLTAALFGVLFGSGLALPAVCVLRRGRLLMTVALAGFALPWALATLL